MVGEPKKEAYSVDQLKAVLGDDSDELAAQIAAAFMTVRDDLQRRLRTAVTAADATAVAAAAHELKGMSAMIGAAQLSMAALTLEEAARTGDRTVYADATRLQAIESRWDQVAQVLQPLLDRA